MKKFTEWIGALREAEKDQSDLQKSYQEYFTAKLKKYGVESPADLDEEKKKEFFNEISADWDKGKGAKPEGEKDIKKHGVKEGIDFNINERSKPKVGDELTMVKNGKKGKVVKCGPDQCDVDFGNGDVYGIVYRRIDGDKIHESVVNESHFKLGDKVKCKDSGKTGEIVGLDKEHGGEDEKYYTVKVDDGEEMKYAPNDLELVKEGKLEGESEDKVKESDNTEETNESFAVVGGIILGIVGLKFMRDLAKKLFSKIGKGIEQTPEELKKFVEDTYAEAAAELTGSDKSKADSWKKDLDAKIDSGEIKTLGELETHITNAGNIFA
jgi:hypothetical protein